MLAATSSVPMSRRRNITQPSASLGQSRSARSVAAGGDAGWKNVARRIFCIDPRSLAVFRIFIGAMLLVDLSIRATDLHAMYTDEGMFSRSLICQHYTSAWNWSFHFGSGSFEYQAILFAFAGLFAIAMAIGFETRAVTILSWLLLVSLQNRVPPILNGSDNLLRMLLFWAMFLPLQRVWSIDTWIANRRKQTAPYVAPVTSIATAGILLQMAFMYFFSAIAKTNRDWLSGSAIAGTLSHDFYAKPLGGTMLQFPALLAVMTVGILALEWIAPLLLFSPWHTARVRLGLLVGLAAMHVGIELFLAVGLFSHVALAGLTVFLPRAFWDSRFIARHSGGQPTSNSNSIHSDKVDGGLGSRIAQGICLAALLYVLAVNINSLPVQPLRFLRLEQWGVFWTATGLGQKWTMFDQIPSKDGWQVAHATLADGAEVDLLRAGAPVDWSRPGAPYRTYPNNRWRKLFREIAYHDALGFQVFRAPIGHYLCREWNAKHAAGVQVTAFDLVFCTEALGATSDGSDEPVREVLVHLDIDHSR